MCSVLETLAAIATILSGIVILVMYGKRFLRWCGKLRRSSKEATPQHKPLSPAERAKHLGISEEEFRAQAKIQAHESLRNKGLLPPELTPREREELEEQAKTAAEKSNRDGCSF